MSSPPDDVGLAADEPLQEALAAGQRLGMLGDRPVDEVIEHSGAFVDALGSVHGTVLDLGSGGGVPGLVIARARPDLRMILVDRRATRTDHLRRVVHRLGLTAQVDVWTLDARRLAATVTSPIDAVVARGFGPPSATLRLAAPLLTSKGLIVVSEPPAPRADRWPAELLDQLHLTRVGHADPRVACFRRA